MGINFMTLSPHVAILVVFFGSKLQFDAGAVGTCCEL